MKLNLLKSFNLKHAIDNTIATIKLLGDKDICVLVPDKLSATMERTIFERLNIESSFNINVSTLNRLSKNILSETKTQYSTISKIGGIILLEKVLNENNIISFKSCHHSYQYSNEIYKTLAQLKACQLTSEELVKYKCSLPALQQKINDLGNIMDLYDGYKAGMLDNSDTLTLTCLMLSKCQTVKNTYYLFVGFDDFTSQAYNLIEQLISCSLGVYVNIYSSNAFNKNIYYNEVTERLIKLCNTMQFDYEFLEYPFVNDDIHKYLSNNLFAFNKLNFITKSANTLRLYQAQNLTDELDFVARDIRTQVLAGARYREFGVAVYGLEGCVDLIKQTFDKYNLCTYIDVQKSFSTTCIYRFFTNLWQLYLKNYESINLIEFINSPFIEVPYNHKQTIIQQIKQTGYRGNLDGFVCGDEDVRLSIQYVCNILNQFHIHPQCNVFDIISKHNQLIDYLNISSIIDNIIDNLQDSYDKKILAQALKSSNQLLQEIAQFYPEADLAKTLDIYSHAGIEQSISPLPLSADCIQIIDAGEIFTSFDNLYIVNCSSSTSPVVMHDVGILPDKELTYVQLSHNIEPTIVRLNRLNKFKLYNNALMFNKHLCISMSLSSDSETSILVKELKSRVMVADNNNMEANIGYISPQQNKPEIYKPLSLWDLLEYIYTNHIEPSSAIKPILNKLNITNIAKDIAVDNKFTDLSEISASALENYFQCPQKYFFTNVLKLKEPISADIQMLDIGNILHELAYLYYKNNNIVDIKSFCHNTIHNIINKDEKLKKQINNPIIVNLIAEAERFILHLKNLDNNSKFIPTYFERSFGSDAIFPALPLTDKVSLKGKIDRVDFYNDHFRIIDYKSGNADASLSELYYGKKLQLFLYALAVSNATNKSLSGTFYLPIQNVVEKADDKDSIYKLLGFYTDDENIAKAYDINIGTNLKSDLVNITLKKDGSISKRTDKALTFHEMDILLDYAKQVSGVALKEIASGKFNSSPLKFDSMHNACTYCPYLALCSKHSNNISFRTQCKVDKNSFTGGDHE